MTNISSLQENVYEFPYSIELCISGPVIRTTQIKHIKAVTVKLSMSTATKTISSFKILSEYMYTCAQTIQYHMELSKLMTFTTSSVVNAVCTYHIPAKPINPQCAH